MSTTPINAAIHGPYEDLAIKALEVVEKLIDGQTPEQRAQIWQNWINFWKPLMDVITNAQKTS
jgi:hypothetical protein